MKGKFSFVYGEANDLSTCLYNLKIQRSKVLKTETLVEIRGEIQFFEPSFDGQKWYAYQQYTYETDYSRIAVIPRKVETVVGTGKTFFLACCDLNNMLRRAIAVRDNADVIGQPMFKQPTKEGMPWKVTQKIMSMFSE